MGCSSSQPSGPKSIADKNDSEPQNGSNPIAVFDCSMGIFKAELYLDRVPLTVSNFVDLAQSGFYDGVHFHRVIPNFMCQFGCPNAKDAKSDRAGTGGPKGGGAFKNLKTGGEEKRTAGGNIQDENISKDSNVPGTLSMANTGQPNSNGSQFFLNVAKNDFLDWFSASNPESKHPVFGMIFNNYKLVEDISKVPTSNDNPNKPIKMEKVTIENLPA